MPRHLRDQLQFRELPTGHLHVHLIAVHVEKGRKQWRYLPRTDGPGLVVAEAEVHANASLASDRFHRPIEEVYETSDVFPVAIATHRRLIDADLATSRGDQRLQFLAYQGQESFSQCPTVRVAQIGVGQEATGQRVGTGNRSLQRHPAGRAQFAGNGLQATVFLDGSQSARGLQWSHDCVASPLVMSRRTPSTGRGRLQIDSLKVAVEAEIEVQPALFAIGDDIQSRSQLILHSTSDRIGLQFTPVLRTKAIQMMRGML